MILYTAPGTSHHQRTVPSLRHTRRHTQHEMCTLHMRHVWGEGEPTGHSLSEPPQVGPRRRTHHKAPPRTLSLTAGNFHTGPARDQGRDYTQTPGDGPSRLKCRMRQGRRCDRQTSGQGSHWLSQERGPLWCLSQPLAPEDLFLALSAGPHPGPQAGSSSVGRDPSSKSVDISV